MLAEPYGGMFEGNDRGTNDSRRPMDRVSDDWDTRGHQKRPQLDFITFFQKDSFLIMENFCGSCEITVRWWCHHRKKFSEEISVESHFKIPNLLPGAVYTIQVFARSVNGVDVNSKIIGLKTDPAPKNAMVSNVETMQGNSPTVDINGGENTSNRRHGEKLGYLIDVRSITDDKKITAANEESSVSIGGSSPGEANARQSNVEVFAIPKGEGSESGRTTESKRTVPAKPDRVKIEETSLNVYEISWCLSVGAESYHIQWKRQEENDFNEAFVKLTKFILKDLHYATTYVVRVAAANRIGLGEFSKPEVLNTAMLPPRKIYVEMHYSGDSIDVNIKIEEPPPKTREFIIGETTNHAMTVRTKKCHAALRNLPYDSVFKVYVIAIGENGVKSGKIFSSPITTGPKPTSPRNHYWPAPLSSHMFISPHCSIVCDGIIYNRERDAPGQNCQYIPPGNHHFEKYRLGTFSAYPNDVPVKVTDMAAAGFYFTGYKDRVKCFSCGLAVENWMLGDDAMDKKWHKTDCKMALGQDLRNEPIPTPNFRSIFRMLAGNHDNVRGMPSLNLGHKNYTQVPRNSGLSNHSGTSSFPTDINNVTSNFGRVMQVSEVYPALVLANILSTEHENLLNALNLKSEVDRRKTYKKWPSYPAPYLPSDLAKEGFFYLGNLDRTQCFSCSGVLRNWAPFDNVKEQHEKHFPNCRVVRMMDSGNVPLSTDERRDADEAERTRLAALLPSTDALVEPPDPSPEEQRHLAEYFPCRDAVNPHMQQLQKRIETFARGWPRERVRAAVAAIAKAGFFYLGESDKTKCFYCNGGLQNWDPDDEPWTEHAKWFPGCEYVLRQKGVEFVRRLVEAHPNLNRPYIRNPVSLDIPPHERERTSPHNSVETQSAGLNLRDVESMGFTVERIQRMVERKAARGGYNNTEDLINDLLAEDDESAENNDVGHSAVPQAGASMEHSNVVRSPVQVSVQAGQKREGDAEGHQNTSIKKTRTATSIASGNEDDEGIQESLRAMEQTSHCRICKNNPVQMVLIPCGHFSVCSTCALTVRRCPICDVKVVSSMKVFRA